MLGAVDGIEEVELQPIAGVLPAHAQIAPVSTAKNLRQDVVGRGHIGKAVGAGIAVPCPAGVIAVEAARRPLGTGGIDLALVVARALLGVADQIVGGRDILELLLRRLVAGVEIGMQLLGERAVGLADVLGGGILGDTQDLVGIGTHSPISRPR